MSTYEIHIKGQVQGVGFRPHVYKCAKNLAIKGWVSNNIQGVHIFFNADKNTAFRFSNKLVAKAPDQAIIESIDMHKSADQYFESFEIIESTNNGPKEVRLSPDFGLCDPCKAEIQNRKNNRHFYAFTTCTNCGPRYSIINELPYDRPTTEMKTFRMCPTCQQEYNDPMDRRFFSQTNSCPDCAVKLSLHCYKERQEFSQEEILAEVVTRLTSGQTVAVKGIGGYLLLCDATDPVAIQSLRSRKKRPEKPLAVMYADLDQIKKEFSVSYDEAGMLSSPIVPIVLLDIKSKNPNKIAVEGIAPNLDKVGVMLPCAPLLYLISKMTDRPLVATSANLSGSPIIYKDEKALDELSAFTDCILTHDRKILVPQDDSVMQVVKGKNEPIILRRSRGYAPSYFGTLPSDMPYGWVGLGAEMKASFAMSIGHQSYVSQYLGNLSSFDAQTEYLHTIKHLCHLLEFEERHIFSDMHAGYFVHQLAKEIPTTDKHSVSFVQHHKAHFAAVLQENHLVESSRSILGVIWDGTGLGDDQTIWGGEFFLYQNFEMERTHHLETFSVIKGDKMAIEPRLSALSLSKHSKARLNSLKSKFDDNEWKFYLNQLDKTSPVTSSMGRLIDGVASILGLIDKSSFEGQGAMYLEAKAREYRGRAFPYLVPIDGKSISHEDLLAGIFSDLKKKRTTPFIAYKLHLTLVEIIRQVAIQTDVNDLAFSGGVFQNRLLVELIITKLSSEFKLHFHKSLSPNDENIGFGQLIYGFIQSQQKVVSYDQEPQPLSK